MFQRRLMTLALGMALTVGTITGVFSTPAEAVLLSAFPPDIQQALRSWWAQVPPDRRLRDIVALHKLAPAQARQVVINYRSPLAGLLAEGWMIAEQVRQSLPPAYQQAFVNGLWGGSPEEERFTTQILSGVLQQMKAADQIAARIAAANGIVRSAQQNLSDTINRGAEEFSHSLGTASKTFDPETGKEIWVPNQLIPGGSYRWWSCLGTAVAAYDRPEDICVETSAPR